MEVIYVEILTPFDEKIIQIWTFPVELSTVRVPRLAAPVPI